jgi:hypothetical protein
MGTLKFPFGDAQITELTDAATSTETIVDALTVLQASSGFAQAVTGLSLTAGVGLNKGAIVIVDVAQNGTGRNVTFGSAGDTIVAPVLTGVLNDRDIIHLVWIGTEFVALSDWYKVVNAV